MLRAFETPFYGCTVWVMSPSSHTPPPSPPCLPLVPDPFDSLGERCSGGPPTWQGLTASPSCCQVHPDLMAWATNWVLGSKHAASLCQPESLLGNQLIFSRCRKPWGNPGKKLRCFILWKNHRRPYFEFLTLTSMQECWSHSHLSDSRAGQLMTEYCLTLTLRSWRGHPLVSCEKLPLPGPWWEFVIISIGLNENLFVLTVKKVFMKLTRNINKNWRGILLLLMCLIC